MNIDEAKEIIEYAGITIPQLEECYKLLSGETPAGEHPRLVGEHAERAGNMEPTTSQGQSLRVGQTKDGVKLQRHTDELLIEAEEDEKMIQISLDDGEPDQAEYWKESAARKREISRIITEILSEPRTMSEAEVVEECGLCRDGKVVNAVDGSGLVPCPKCEPHGGDAGSGACLPNDKCAGTDARRKDQ